MCEHSKAVRRRFSHHSYSVLKACTTYSMDRVLMLVFSTLPLLSSPCTQENIILVFSCVFISLFCIASCVCVSYRLCSTLPFSLSLSLPLPLLLFFFVLPLHTSLQSSERCVVCAPPPPAGRPSITQLVQDPAGGAPVHHGDTASRQLRAMESWRPWDLMDLQISGRSDGVHRTNSERPWSLSY